MPERDELDDLADSIKNMGQSLMAAYEKIREFRKNEEARKTGERQSELQQEQLQAFQEKQLEMLEGIREGLKKNGIPDTEKNLKIGEAQVKQLQELDNRETGIKDRMGKIDERLEAIDKEQHDLLNPKVEGEKPDTEKLQKLSGEREKLKGEKAGLGKELDGIGVEKQKIKNGEGLQGLEGVPTRKRSNAISGNSLKPSDDLGIKMGNENSASIGQERSWRPGSVGESLQKEGYKIGQGPKIGIGRGAKVK